MKTVYIVLYDRPIGYIYECQTEIVAVYEKEEDAFADVNYRNSQQEAELYRYESWYVLGTDGQTFINFNDD
jgi:hypothetical protein